MGVSLLVLSDSTVNPPKQLPAGGSYSDFAKSKSNLYFVYLMAYVIVLIFFLSRLIVPD